MAHETIESVVYVTGKYCRHSLRIMRQDNIEDTVYRLCQENIEDTIYELWHRILLKV